MMDYISFVVVVVVVVSCVVLFLLCDLEEQSVDVEKPNFFFFEARMMCVRRKSSVYFEI